MELTANKTAYEVRMQPKRSCRLVEYETRVIII